MVQLYSMPDGMRYFFNEFQYYSDVIAGATTLTAGTVIQSIIKGNINQPIQTLFVLLRWQNDLQRAAAGANGDRGRDISNFGGWYDAGGLGVRGSTRIFTHAAIRSGNNVVYEQMPVEELFIVDRNKYFPGFPGAAILVFNFSRQPTMTNSFLGAVDFSMILYVNGGAGHATINAAATADIGGNSDLQIDYIASYVHRN